MNDGEGRFLIKNVDVRSVEKWEKYRPDLYTSGMWIAWNLVNTKLHVEKEKMQVEATSEATDKAGPQEVEEGRGRK